ncbi:MAG: hypothetical protein ACM3TR_13040 [Caulobacteraceae bacterium]
MSPAVQLGTPDMPEAFDLYYAGDLNIYIRKGIRARNDLLRIFMRKFFWVQTIEVDGMMINY